MSISVPTPLMRSILQNKYALRIAAFAFALLCVIIFNLKNPPGPSAEVRAYEVWLGVVERNEVDSNGNPLPVSITLVSKDPSNSFSWSLAADSISKRRTIVRILQLLRESEIDTLSPLEKGKNPPPPSEDSLLFTAQNEAGTFIAEIPPSAVKSSIQLQNMIKLFQVVQLAK